MDILVDSTHYISLLRKGLDPRHELAGWAASGRLHGCGVVRAEVLRACRHPEIKADLAAFFDLLPEPLLDPQFWREVMTMIIGPSPQDGAELADQNRRLLPATTLDV